MELGEGVVVGVGLERTISDGLDRFLPNGGPCNGLPDDHGVESVAFDPGKG